MNVNSKEYWNRFLASGSVNDYLAYARESRQGNQDSYDDEEEFYPEDDNDTDYYDDGYGSFGDVHGRI